MKTSKRKAKSKANILDRPKKIWLFKTLGLYTCVFCHQPWPCLLKHSKVLFSCGRCIKRQKVYDLSVWRVGGLAERGFDDN